MLFTRSILNSGGFGALGANVEHELHAHKGKYIFQGIVFVVAGILAAVFPAATALNVEMIVGAILLMTGVFQLVLTLRSKLRGWSLLSACLSMAIGMIMLWHPQPILMAFVTLLAIFMSIEGALELLLAFQFRPSRNWSWMFFSGIVTLVLAVILWIGFPVFDVMYLGWAIAINLVLYGLSLLMLVWKTEP
jgi:uncharacterized membrane protein HdeD (DUF308 family)